MTDNREKARIILDKSMSILFILLISAILSQVLHAEENSDNPNEVADQIDGEDDFVISGVYYELTDDEPVYLEGINGTNNTEFDRGISGNVIIGEADGIGLSDVYIELDEHPVLHLDDLLLTFKDIRQGKAMLNAKVEWSQDIVIENLIDQENTVSINLWNYPEYIPKQFMHDVETIQIFLEGEQISETAVATFLIDPNDRIVLTVVYQTPEVKMTKSCGQKTIKDLIPEDAVLLESEIDVNTEIGEVCDVRIYHETLTHYNNIELILDDFETALVEKIYYVEGETYLDIVDNTVVVADKQELDVENQEIDSTGSE